MNPLPLLLRKEFKQNAVIYILPLFCLALLLVMQTRRALAIPHNWLAILSTVIPVALAFAYGLQAFDLEENGQTRDFLLTRPLSVAAIMAAKYWCGLAVLLIFASLWPAVLVPAEIHWPDPASFQTFYYLMYLLLVTILFSVSFVVGILVKGPLKLVAAVLAGLAVVAWFFYNWLQFLTFIYYQIYGNLSDPVFAGLLLLTTAVLLGLLIFCLLRIGSQSLRNLPLTGDSRLMKSAIFVAIIPVLALAILWIHRPAIRPFDSLAATVSGNEKWFVPVEGAWQPHGRLYLFNSTAGQLGIARYGQKPRPIYTAPSSETALSDLSWSPDGKRFAFKEGNRFKIATLQRGRYRELYTLAGVDWLCWSNESQTLLTAKELAQKPGNGGAGQTLQLNRLNPATRQTVAEGVLRSNGIAHAWDAALHKLIVLDPQWKLVSIDTATKQVQLFNLLNSNVNPKNVPPLVYGRIVAPPSDSHRFQASIVTYPSHGRYMLFLYDLDVAGQTVRLRRILKNVNYRDLLLAPDGRGALARSSGVTYFAVPELSKAR